MIAIATVTLAVTRAGRGYGTWTQTLRLAADDSGEMLWRREDKGDWEAERWTLGRGGVPIREVVEGTIPRKRGETRLGRFRVVVAYRWDTADALVERTDRAPRKSRFAVPAGVPRGLPTPRAYRRFARAGKIYRFAKFDAFRLKWDVIEGRTLGVRDGHPTFREHNPNVPATWTYTLDGRYGILGIDLGGGYAARADAAHLL